MYRFVFRTSNFQDVRARACVGTRAHIIKRVTRFKWFRGFAKRAIVCVSPGLDFIACARRTRGIRLHGKNISCDAHTRSLPLSLSFSFNMLLLFAFRFCYASLRAAAFCARRIQTFDVRMNGYFRATPSRCGLTFMRITFIEVRSTASVFASSRRLNKHEIFNKLHGIFRKVPKQLRNATVESNGSGRRSAIQFEQKFGRSLSLRISQLGYPIL